MSLETLHPDFQEMTAVKQLRAGLGDLLMLMDVPEGKMLSLDEVKAIRECAQKLARIAAPKSAE